MLRISTSIAVAAGLLLALSGGVRAAELGEKAAVKRAVAILKGNPYGETDAEVVAALRERRLGPRADTVCGGGATRVWSFHVVVPQPAGDASPIDGWLVIDATSGRIVCANLPMLD